MLLVIFSGFRGWLFYERTPELRGLTWGQRLKLFRVGSHLDSVMVSRMILIMIVFLLLAPGSWIAPLRPVILTFSGALFFLVILFETAGVYFFRFYDFRPNYLVFEHGFDVEVLQTVRKAYPVTRIVLSATIGTALCLFMLRQLTPLDVSKSTIMVSGYPVLWDHLWMLFLLFLAGIASRGSLGRRPLNPSAGAVTTNRIANEIASSGVFNVLYEWNQQVKGNYQNLRSLIKTLPAHEATSRARRVLAAQGKLTDDSPNPLVRLVQGKESNKPLNVVLVVMESFTSRLVGALDGCPALTPELDRLASEGVLLETCYATGERTIQGLEALVSSFPPLPGVGVVRRPQARTGFTTLASLLKESGYSTLFLYGGQGIFDHMRAFYLGNGFDLFIEEKDFEEVEFKGAWGVSDEDLFRRADREFRRLTEIRQPFFATILTVSLHSPWEYPKGRFDPLPTDIQVPSGFEYEELNNFLYADYAIGRFIREARKAPYFDDTLFVFVGDHGVHLRGRELIPVDENRVLALFLAPKHLRPNRIRRVTSQLDIPPTVMGILGGTYRSPFFGSDILTQESDDGLAIMIYNKKRYGIISGPNLTIFSEAGKELAYERSSLQGPWNAVPLSPKQNEYSRDAIALLQAAEQLLKNSQYTTARQDTESDSTKGSV